MSGGCRTKRTTREQENQRKTIKNRHKRSTRCGCPAQTFRSLKPSPRRFRVRVACAFMCIMLAGGVFSGGHHEVGVSRQRRARPVGAHYRSERARSVQLMSIATDGITLGAQPGVISHGTGATGGGSLGGHQFDQQPVMSQEHSSGMPPAAGSSFVQSTAHCRTNTPTCSSGTSTIGISSVVPAATSLRHPSVFHSSAWAIGPGVELMNAEQLPGRQPRLGSTEGQPPFLAPEHAGQWYCDRITSHGLFPLLHGHVTWIAPPDGIGCSRKNPRVGGGGRQS